MINDHQGEETLYTGKRGLWVPPLTAPGAPDDKTSGAQEQG